MNTYHVTFAVYAAGQHAFEGRPVRANSAEEAVSKARAEANYPDHFTVRLHKVEPAPQPKRTYFVQVTVPVWFDAEDDVEARAIAFDLSYLDVNALLQPGEGMHPFDGRPMQCDGANIEGLAEDHVDDAPNGTRPIPFYSGMGGMHTSDEAYEADIIARQSRVFATADGARLRFERGVWTDGAQQFESDDIGRPLDSNGEPLKGRFA